MSDNPKALQQCWMHCPRCNAGKEDLLYDREDWDEEENGQIRWSLTCNRCGAEAVELFDFTYLGTTDEHPQGS